MALLDLCGLYASECRPAKMGMDQCGAVPEGPDAVAGNSLSAGSRPDWLGLVPPLAPDSHVASALGVMQLAHGRIVASAFQAAAWRPE